MAAAAAATAADNDNDDCFTVNYIKTDVRKVS